MHRFNKYTWTLLIIYLIVSAAMQYFSPGFSWQSIRLSFPLIAAFMFWSEETTWIMQKPDGSLTKKEAFHRDAFLIGFSFICGDLLSLFFQYNSSDALGWWPVEIYIISVFGVLFAIIFSLIAMMLDKHRKYTLIYCVIIVLFLQFVSFMMYLDSLSIFAKSKTFDMLFLFLIGVHLLLCLGYKAIYGRHFNSHNSDEFKS